MWSPTGKTRGTSPNRPWGGILSEGQRLKAVARVEGSIKRLVFELTF